MNDPRPRRLRRALLIVAGVALALVVLLVGVVVFLRARDSTTVVSVDEAVGSFRDVADADASESHRPEPGVYLYETVGDEHIDALGGATHTYPAQTTMSVTGKPRT